MSAVVQKIREVGIVPVVRATSSDEALAVVEAIRAGGIPILEITLTVPGAVKVIAELARRLGDEALIGAGTVLDAQSARQCIDAGMKPSMNTVATAPSATLAQATMPGDISRRPILMKR